MSKTELLDIASVNTPAETVFVIDEMLEANGLQVLRLPQYQCELNAVELGCGRMKRYTRERNTAGDLSMFLLYRRSFNDKVIKLEQEFWANDGGQQEVHDRIVNFSADFHLSPEERTGS
ncbi:hypothetical protein GE061_000562 [Apolygus lucorum]|uniref:Tc1-like transposase DDE domain-containing protein n=1 Tax=Apolygus lucorum TaxID=248454 RepID=A0A6A4KKN2_APOLU|nr:hypothetical protein GE061_000562 [Apolygus lucorum]